MPISSVKFEITPPSLGEVEQFGLQSIEDTYNTFQAECLRVVSSGRGNNRLSTEGDVSATLETHDAAVEGGEILVEDRHLLDLRGATTVDAEKGLAYSGVMKLRASLRSQWAPREDREVAGSPSLGIEYWIEPVALPFKFPKPIEGPITPHFLEELGILEILQERVPSDLVVGRNDVLDETVVVAGVDDEVAESSRLIKIAFGVATQALKKLPKYVEPDWSQFRPVVGSNSGDRERLERLHRY
jgi:hypothetical protein